MQYQPNPTCCGPNPSVTGWCYSGCGQLMPIVPGSSPALQVWNGQNFVVSDGSSNNPIFLPNLQANSGIPTAVVGSNNSGQLFFYPYAVPTSVSNLAGGAAGDIPWQSATSVTNFVSAGNVNEVLVSGGAGSPSWIAPSNIPEVITNQGGTTYTLQSSDIGTLIKLSASASISLVVPNNSSVQFQVGQRIDLLASGTGQVTVSGAAGVTVNSSYGLKLRTQYSPASLLCLGINQWVLMGDTTP